MLSARREIAVTAALLHVMGPHQVELLLTVTPHTLISLKTHTQPKSSDRHIDSYRDKYLEMFSHISLLVNVLFNYSLCTFPGGVFHSEASKGREVSPEVRQALREQQ